MHLRAEGHALQMGQADLGSVRVPAAFHPAANWFDPDVLGIDQGISVLMSENLRSGLVWNTFMRNRESLRAMERAGFHGKGLAA